MVAVGAVGILIGAVMLFMAFNRRARKTSEETLGEIRFRGGPLYSSPGFAIGGGLIAILGIGIAVYGLAS